MGRESPGKMFKNNALQRKIENELHISPSTVQDRVQLAAIKNKFSKHLVPSNSTVSRTVIHQQLM